MNRVWHFYDPATGIFAGRSFSGPDRALSANTPPGLQAFDGVVDALSQKIDLATGKVIDYQPPQPSPDYIWDATVKRWQMDPAVLASQAKKAAAQRTINSLEASQARIIREYILGDATAKKRLQDLDTDIAGLRKQL